jgi:hypothetical protein
VAEIQEIKEELEMRQKAVMKMWIVFLIALIFLWCTATTVGAATDYTFWSISFRASDVDFNNANIPLQLGVSIHSLDGKDGADFPYITPDPGQATVVSYESLWLDQPPYYRRNIREPRRVPGDWMLLLCLTPEYSYDTVRLAWWSPSSLYTPSFGYDGLAHDLRFTVISDPTGTYQPGHQWIWQRGGIGTSTDPVGFADFNNAQVLKMADADAATQGVKIHVACFPEPTTLSALAMGIAAIAGFSRRPRIKR